MSTIEFISISKYYGDVLAVDQLSQKISDGEFCVFVGPSGCGKTTALRMLAGLESLSEGDITIGEKSVIHLPAMDRNIAMVFQNYALYPHMTVAENMGFALRMQKVPRDEIVQRVRRTAALLSVEELLERRPRQLSGGQRQRVAVGRAIVRDPEVFLFDEPLSNLDAKLRNAARVELRELQQRLGTTTLYVTHDQIEAMTMADIIVLMNAGRVVQAGPPMKLYDDPETTFVASFMGSPPMNLIPAVVTDNGDRSGMLVAGRELEMSIAAAPGTELIFGVRPEGVTFGVPERAGELGISAQLVRTEQLGGETVLHLDADGHPLLSKVADRPALRAGETVNVVFNRKSICLFDATGERRLTWR